MGKYRCYLFVWFLGTAAFCQGLSEDHPDRPGRKPHHPGPDLIRVADDNHDHQIERAEWDTFLSSLSLLEDGSVDLHALHERLRASRDREPRKPEGNHPLDLNGDGQVDPDDFERLFAYWDRNGDEVLEQAELPRRRGRHGTSQRSRPLPDRKD